jgi:hypothetical protein
MNEQEGRWPELWREQVLPSARKTPALALEARLGDQDGPLVAEMVRLVQGNYTAPQWLDVSLYEPKPNGRLYVVAVGSVAGEPWTEDSLHGQIVFANSFADALAELRRLLPPAQRRDARSPT